MNVHPAIQGEHRVFDFHGSPFEIGVQHGRALRAKITEEFAGISQRIAEAAGISVDGMINEAFEKHAPLFRQRLPQAMEEVEGIAEGTGLTVAQAFYAALRDGMKRPPAKSACTAFACGPQTTKDRKALLGQTKDTGLSTERYHIMRYSYSTGQRRIVLNYAGWVGNIGLTNDGMSFAGTSLYGKAPSGDTAPYSLLKRMALESRNVGEFLKGIEGLTFENGCFVIGDRSGRTVCIECIGGRLNIRDVSGLAFAHANSILSDEFKGLEDKVLGSPSSPTRQKQMQRMLDEQRGTISVDSIKKMVADHTEYPRSVCLHSHDGEPHHTTAAFIANLTDLTMDIAIGNPCGNEFVRYVLPD